MCFLPEHKDTFHMSWDTMVGVLCVFVCVRFCSRTLYRMRRKCKEGETFTLISDQGKCLLPWVAWARPQPDLDPTPGRGPQGSFMCPHHKHSFYCIRG